jgi:hypothetical protein
LAEPVWPAGRVCAAAMHGVVGFRRFGDEAPAMKSSACDPALPLSGDGRSLGYVPMSEPPVFFW